MALVDLDRGDLQRTFRRANRFDPVVLVESLRAAPDVTVVIPVYGGGEVVRECLLSVIDHTHRRRVIVVDDCSPDPETVAILAEMAALHEVEVFRNETNLGYTATVNRGIELAGDHDVVTLNSDTEVGPLWLERLRRKAYSRYDVASVSAVSDNAGAMAMPVAGRHNAWQQDDPDWSRVARYVGQRTRAFAIESPTGHGFCMYLRRDAIDMVGRLDVESFPRGYGEENDWSMRALEAGLVNLVAPDVMVRHAEGATFGEGRRQLIATSRKVVDVLHPSYTRLVRQWAASEPMAALRDEYQAVFDSLPEAVVKPRTLYVVHASSGGTPATNRDLMSGLSDEQEAFVLTVHVGSFKFSRWVDGHERVLATWKPTMRFLLRDDWRPDYAAALGDLLVRYSIELVHIRHLMYQPLGTLPLLTKILGIPMVLSTHDFYYICPTLHLLDEKKTFCGGVCTPGEGHCTLPNAFTRGAPALKHQWISEWKARATKVLDIASTVVATTPSAAGIYAANYPAHAGKLRIIEHGRDLDDQWTGLRQDRPRRPGPLRVACPAHWATQKGPDYIRAMAEELGDLVEWHMLGNRSEFLGDLGVSHGTYSRDTAQTIFDQIDPDFIGLFSIWPETYSHTLTEARGLDVPVVATAIGAVADRIESDGGGVVFPVDDPSAAAAFLREQALRLATTGAVVEIDVPQHATRSRTTMAYDYAALYLGARQSLPHELVGHVRRDDDGPLTPAELRRLGAQRALVRPIVVHDLIHGLDHSAYDRVVIDDGVTPEPELLSALDTAGTRLERFTRDSVAV